MDEQFYQARLHYRHIQGAGGKGGIIIEGNERADQAIEWIPESVSLKTADHLLKIINAMLKNCGWNEKKLKPGVCILLN